jgi:hypothetical protein
MMKSRKIKWADLESGETEETHENTQPDCQHDCHDWIWASAFPLGTSRPVEF